MSEQAIQTPLAKSRLKSSGTAEQSGEQLVPAKKKSVQQLDLVAKYKSKISTLLIGIFFLFLLVVFLNTVQPNQVQNFLFQNSFLPFLLLIGISLFFITSFLLLNSRRGLFISVGVTLGLWVKLTNPENILLIICSATALVIWFSSFEIILLKIKRKQTN